MCIKKYFYVIYVHIWCVFSLSFTRLVSQRCSICHLLRCYGQFVILIQNMTRPCSKETQNWQLYLTEKTLTSLTPQKIVENLQSYLKLCHVFVLPYPLVKLCLLCWIETLGICHNQSSIKQGYFFIQQCYYCEKTETFHKYSHDINRNPLPIRIRVNILNDYSKNFFSIKKESDRLTSIRLWRTLFIKLFFSVTENIKAWIPFIRKHGQTVRWSEAIDT